MSFFSLCNHTCDLYDLILVDNDGAANTAWVKINTEPVNCRLDLNFLRLGGRDKLWVETSAKPTDRVGTLLFMPDAPIKSGMRVIMVDGPSGTFQIGGSIDEAWGYDSLDHYEVGVSEVSPLLARSSLSQHPGV